ncbi:uncharacterized protein LOC121243090 [Juglans microcarpa x Juglans regia]|uniref:uncharacterized protein LOC121243090 n=1 Tax=Juglans microcarpa x Juglans regia TaxID=2249226 RepID=UPI001B7F269E|nr:uncharacterized protein LOC121243090 [Juglans microcarpa x Juglans regia]
MVSQGRLVLGLALISILSLFFYSPLGTNAATHELVEGVCKEAVERATKGNIVTYENCLEALESDSRTRTTSNLKALAKIALELALANATESEAYVDDLLKKNRTSAPLEACSSWYDSAVGSFRSALGELDDDVEVASYDVRIAADDANYCEDALASGGVKVPSISTRNDYIKLYSFIGYVIIDKL